MLPLSTAEDEKCKDHEGEINKFYCETCIKPVCRDCILMKQYCRDHEYIALKEASEKHAAKLTQFVTESKNIKKSCQDAIQKTESVEQKLRRSVITNPKRISDIRNDIRKVISETLTSDIRNMLHF